MIKILDYLEQLGLSETEAKLYLTLLKMGPISIRELAETTKIKRTTAYLYIDQLIDKGLVFKIVRESKKLVEANTPEENLKHLVDKKLARAKEAQTNLPDMLSLLTQSLPQDEEANEAEIRYYKGKRGVQKIYDEALNCSELRLYLTLSEIAPLFPENDNLFEKSFEKNKDLKIFEIYGDASEKIKDLDYTVKNDRYFYKVMPSSVHLTAACILIYDSNKVAIINIRSEKSINSIVLHNKDFYNNSKELFDFIWSFLPERT